MKADSKALELAKEHYVDRLYAGVNVAFEEAIEIYLSALPPAPAGGAEAALRAAGINARDVFRSLLEKKAIKGALYSHVNTAVHRLNDALDTSGPLSPLPSVDEVVAAEYPYVEFTKAEKAKLSAVILSAQLKIAAHEIECLDTDSKLMLEASSCIDDLLAELDITTPPSPQAPPAAKAQGVDEAVRAEAQAIAKWLDDEFDPHWGQDNNRRVAMDTAKEIAAALRALPLEDPK